MLYALPDVRAYWRGIFNFMHMGKKSFMVIAVLLATSLSNSLSAQEKFRRNLEGGTEQTVVVYGTSLSASPEGWPKMLEQSIDSLYPGQVKVINSAVGGMWSTWGVQNLDERVISKKPDLLLIEFTINDAYLPYNTSTEVCRINIEYMIDRVREALPECEVVLQVMNMPIAEHLESRPHFRDYNDVYYKVGRRRGLKVIDHTKYWEDILAEGEDNYRIYMPDGLHPEKTAWETLVTPYVMRGLGF